LKEYDWFIAVTTKLDGGKMSVGQTFLGSKGAEPEKVLMYENNLADRHLVKRTCQPIKVNQILCWHNVCSSSVI
jgi:hypothetical protein